MPSIIPNESMHTSLSSQLLPSTKNWCTSSVVAYIYPVINEYIVLPNKSYINQTISTIVSENLLDLENKNILKDMENKSLPEIIVNFSDNEIGKMNVKLNFNRNLSLKEKKKKKNIILIPIILWYYISIQFLEQMEWDT